MERGRLREQRLDAREEVGRRFRKDVDLRKWSAARTCARAHVRIECFQAVGEEVAARGPGMREDRTLAAARRAEAREAFDVCGSGGPSPSVMGQPRVGASLQTI